MLGILLIVPYGGFHPFPKRYGGAARSHLEVIHASLNAQRGTALDATNPATIVWLENMAIARAITFDGWGVNQRLALQWDPTRTTDMLERWETIFGLPFITVPAYTRRERLTRSWRAFGGLANTTRLTDELKAACGDFFVAVEYISPSVALVNVPDVSYPWGTVFPGRTWYSTVAHILVKMQKPVGATEGDFYEAAGKVGPILDPIIPIWSTFDYYRGPDSGAIDVPGGPSAGGFYLDTDHNLDGQVFDE